MSRRAAIAFVVGATVVAIFVRLVVAPEGGGLVDVDGDLHLRRALEVDLHGPGSLFALDRMIAWPQGAHVNWPPGFDLALALLAKVAGAARFERAAAVAIPVLGGLAIPIAYVLARTVLDRNGACVVVAAVTILPAHVELTRIGRVDHHVIEPTLLWWSIAWLIASVQKRSRWRAVGSGIVLAVLFLCSPTALLGAVIFGGAALWLAREDERMVAWALVAAAAAIALDAAAVGALRKFTVDETSLAQPVFFCLAAAGVLVARRRWALLFATGGVLAVAALLTARGGGAFMLAGRQGLAGTILESRGMFSFDAFGALAPLTPLAFLAPIAAVFVLRRRGSDPARVLVAALAVALLALAIVQRRFMHLCGAPLAILLCDALFAFQGDARTAVASAALGLALPHPMMYLSHRPPGSPRDAAVREVAPLLKRLPAGGVLAQWPLGHILARLGEHPVVASPLLTPETSEAALGGTRILLDGDPARSLAAMDATGVRYVVATALPPAALPRYLGALDDARPPAEVLQSALVARLSREDGSGIPGLRELAGSSDGRAKLFVRVRGASLEGSAAAQSEVIARVGMLDPTGMRRFMIEQRTRAGADGHFRLLLPYPTEPDPVASVRPSGPWRVIVDGAPRFVQVSLDDVERGATVVLR